MSEQTIKPRGTDDSILRRFQTCPELGLALIKIVKDMVPMYDAWLLTGGNGKANAEISNRAARFRKVISDIETAKPVNFVIDPTVPPGEIQFRNADNETVGKITGIQHGEPTTDSNGLGQ